MTLIVYPATLPNPSVSGVTPNERRLLSDVSGGPQQTRGVQRDYLGSQRLEWSILSATDAAAFDLWWKTTLIYGGAWFASTWPAPQGWVSAVRRFAGAPQWAHLPGGFWKVSATVQVRGISMPPNVGGTVLLMHFDASIADSKGHNAYLYNIPGWAAESATISATAPIMGSGSLVCAPYQTAGSFSNIIVAVDSSADFDLPGEFTIEFSQIGPASTGSAMIPLGRSEFHATDYTGGGTIVRLWEFIVQTGNIAFVCTNQDGTFNSISGVYTGSVLQRYAVTRDTSQVLRLYIEGALVASKTGVDATLTGTLKTGINGRYQTYSPLPNNWSSGKYDEIRITKGTALYTGASYTLATTPFTG